MKKTSTLIKIFNFSILILLLCCSYAIADDPCPTLGEYRQSGIGENFILKGAYDIISKACASVANFSWKTFAKPLQAVVGLGTAIYIAVYTLKNIGSFSQQDTSAYLSNEKSGVIPIAVKMAAIVWLLGNQEFLYKNLIGMAITTGMEIGTMISADAIQHSFNSTTDLEGLFTIVIKQIIAFNNTIYKIVATGQLLVCMALSPDGPLNYYWSVALMGGALFVYGWMLVIGVSFYMIDVLFRLGVGCIVLPFAIACGLSKLTSDYTKKTWSLFMNVCFNFIMLGIVIKFTNEMIQTCVGLDIPEDKILNEADIKQIAENIGFSTFVITSLCCMISYQLFMQIENIVTTISGTSAVGSVGRQTGAKLSRTALAPAKKTLSETGKLAAAGMQEAGERGSQKFKESRLYQSIHNNRVYQTVFNNRFARAYRNFKLRHVLRMGRR